MKKNLLICALIVFGFGIANAAEIKGLMPEPALTVYIVNEKENSKLTIKIRKANKKTGERLMVRVFDPAENIVFRKYFEKGNIKDKTTLGSVEKEAGVAIVDRTKKNNETVYFNKELRLKDKGIYQVRVTSGTFNSSVDLLFDSDKFGISFQNGYYKPWQKMNKKMFIYIPPHAEELSLSKENILKINGKCSKKYSLKGKEETVETVLFLNTNKFKFTAWGIPFILCNSREAAKKIKASVFVNADGIAFAWKFQDKIHQLIKKYSKQKYVGKTEELIISDFKKYKKIYDKNPRKYSHLFSPFDGLLIAINPILKAQNLDAKSPFAGAIAANEKQCYDNFKSNKGQYGGVSSSKTRAAAEKLAIAATLNDPGNPYYGKKELIYRASIASLRDLCTITESEIFTGLGAERDPYPGFMGFVFGQKTFPIFAVAASEVPQDIKNLWEKGLEHLADRAFSDGLVSARNQSSHYLVVFQSLANGSGKEIHKKMAKNYADRFINGTPKAGYQLESQGPDASYAGMSHYHMGVYFQMSKDKDMLELLRKAYDFFNHTMSVEPDGTLISGFNFNHRIGQGTQSEQWGGAKGIVNSQAPEIAIRKKYSIKNRPKINLDRHPETFQKSFYGIGYNTSFSRFKYYEADIKLNGYELPSERKRTFIKNIADELIAVKTPSYYTAIFVGSPAPVKHYIRNRDYLRKKDAKINFRKVAPYLGGGMTILSSEPYGASVLGTPWNPLCHNGIVGEKNNQYYTEDYFSTKFKLDKNDASLKVNGKMESSDVYLERKYKFLDNKIQISVKLTGKGNFDKIYEIIPIAAGRAKNNQVYIEKRDGKIIVRDKKGAGIDITIRGVSGEARIIKDGPIMGKLQINRIEIPVKLNSILNYEISFVGKSEFKPLLSKEEKTAWEVNKDTNFSKWIKKNVKIKEKADCFIFDTTKGAANIVFYPKYKEECPYLVFKINKVTKKPGYHALFYPMIRASKNAMFISAGKIFPGIYTLNIFENNNAKPVENTPLFTRMDIHNATIEFEYIKTVSIPENYILLKSKSFAKKKKLSIGDDLTIKVILNEPAEGVSINYIDSYGVNPIKINGGHGISLKAQDKSKKIWSSTINIKSIQKPQRGTQYTPGKLFIKATVKGGKLKNMPLWTLNNYLIEVKK